MLYVGKSLRQEIVRERWREKEGDESGREKEK